MALERGRSMHMPEQASTVRQSRRLLVLACSARKLPDRGLLPAVERYDGPRYRVLRKYLRERADAQRDLDVLILSAEFGLIDGCTGIPLYDRSMSAERAQQLAPASTARFREAVATGRYGRLFVEAGHQYLASLGGRDAVLAAVSNTQIVQGSPGQRLAALRTWLLADQ